MEYCELWSGLGLVKRMYSDRIEPICRKYDLTRMEMDIMLFLANHPQIHSAAEMIRMKGFTKSHVSSSLKHLEQQGYLCRELQSGNHKNIHVSLLLKAEQPVTEGCAVQQQFIEDLLKGISEQHRELLAAGLEQIYHNLTIYTN